MVKYRELTSCVSSDVDFAAVLRAGDTGSVSASSASSELDMAQSESGFSSLAKDSASPSETLPREKRWFHGADSLLAQYLEGL